MTCIFYNEKEKICVHPNAPCYLVECYIKGICKQRIDSSELTRKKELKPFRTHKEEIDKIWDAIKHIKEIIGEI